MSDIGVFLKTKRYFLLFIVLETIALSLIIRYNNHQRDIFQYNLGLVVNKIKKSQAEVSSYFSLKNENKDLRQSTSQLMKTVQAYKYETLRNTSRNQNISDSTLKVIPGRVIDNHISGAQNYLLLDVGKSDSVREGSGVFTPKGIVGLVHSSTSDYSKVISCLHRNTSISAGLMGSNYFGYLEWQGDSYTSMSLLGIPQYAPVQKGDSVICKNQWSFPLNHPIGLVSDIQTIPGTDLYELTVDLFQDLRNVKNVLIYDSPLRDQIDSLQTQAN